MRSSATASGIAVAVATLRGLANPFSREVVFDCVPPSGGRYRFHLRRAKEGWRAYILDQPDYAGRAADLSTTHRNFDCDRGQYFVDRQPAPQRRDAARAVAALWAEKTTRYCCYGELFV